ncbi:hypothetical protein GGS23DRAFT_565096 [Durotheca rogersii]|uniref:uncharacterized protein n=1 Tax=Durotheca rogersii TaxID=419775 RepID=UPI002220AB4B|nr:uncharacterized protein GGS23DRAFT_565096 [Durotheca rogersii]KAI5863731.1 hypothetical protein GGS23DRAFT_565096 [Durotheca rogersii]
MDAGVDTNDVRSKVLQNTLAEVASRSREDTDDPTEACCVICLDSITQPCAARPCSHRNFDYVCLLNWLERQTTCPLCKCQIEEVWHDLEGDDPDKKTAVYKVPRPTEQPSQQRIQPQLLPYPPRSDPLRPDRRRHEDAPRRVTPDEAILRRRHIYRNQLYSLHVGSNRRSGYRDLTPQIFASDPGMVSRARTWLRRELQVFEYLHTPPTGQFSDEATTRRRANNAEFLLEYIIAILKTVDIQGSQGQAEEMLKDFLGRDHTRLLLHELNNFLRSPLSIEAWDRKVQYPPIRKRPMEDGQDNQDERARQSHRRRLADAELNGRPHGEPAGQRWRAGSSYRPTYTSHYHRTAEDRRRPRPD